MTRKINCFVDASVLIHAAAKPTAQSFVRRMRAVRIINDPNRQFVCSEFLTLEVLPIARFFNIMREIQYYETFFQGVAYWAPCESLLSPALELAGQFGLGALDALHICAAKHFDAEFVSAERPTKPIYRAYANITSIYED